MKTVYKQVLPIVAGTGLWLLGNVLLAPSPARGSATEAQSNPGCHPENIEFSGHQECGTAVNGSCPGNWVDGTYAISECNGADISADLFCDPKNPGPATVFYDINQGQCDFFQGFCVQGRANASQVIHAYKADQPFCRNADAQTVTP